ncbi:MAG TPA: DJ-1/PfpI family protein [Bacillota bacterium]|nr:DJ-1/PfpI family protein [Bacillota bacterium]
MVYVHLADGFEEIEALTAVDILRRADIPVQTVSVMDGRTVMGAHNIPVIADLLFAEADYDSCEMIVLPGGMPGTANLGGHEGLGKQLDAFASHGKWIAAICAAPSVLGKMSLLKGKRATSFPGVENELIGAEYSEERVVLDGKIVTSRSAGTAMEFALELVRLLKDEPTADALKKSLITPF